MSKHTKGPTNGITTFERLEGRTLLSLTLNSPEFGIAAASAPRDVAVGATSTSYENGEPAVATNARGDAVVAWSADGANGVDVYARRYAAGGAPLGDAFVVNSSLPGDQASADVALDAAGNFVISWTSRGTGPTPGVYMRQFDATGHALAGERLVAAHPTGTTTTTVLTMPHSTRVAMTPDGRFAIGYDADDVYLHCYTADGTSVSSTRVSAATAAGGWAELYGVLADATGNYTVVFDNNDFYLAARRYTPAGAPITGIIDLRAAAAPYGFAGTPAMDAAGNLVIPWYGLDNVVRARRFNPDLTPAGAAFTVDTSAGAPTAAFDAAGNLTFAYTAIASPAYYIKLKTYPANGAAPSTFRVLSPTGARRDTSEVAATADGSVFLISRDSLAPRAVYGRWYQGFTNAASLGDRVWYDTNRNGVQDAAEGNVANATLTLFDESGLEILQTTTSSTGQYAFEVMPGQRVYVQLAPSTAYFPTIRAAGADPSLDSDIDPATWRTDVVTLAENEVRTNLDAGVVSYASVFGTAFHDVDRDGVKDLDEPALSGWTIYADVDGDGQLTPGEPSAQTPADGVFRLFGVTPGDVAIRAVPQPRWDAPPARVASLKPGQILQPFVYGLTTDVFTGMPRESGTLTNPSPVGTSGAPDVAVDGQGRSTLVWGSGANLYFQRLAADAARTPLAPAAVIATGKNIQQAQVIVSAAGDLVVVSWRTDDPRTPPPFTPDYPPITYVQRFDGEGRPLGEAVKVTINASADPAPVALTALKTGGFLMAGLKAGVITVERYAADGSFVGTPITANPQRLGWHPTIASDDTGAFIVAWDAPDEAPVTAGDRDVYVRLFAADGTPVTDETRLNSYARGHQSAPMAAGAGDGQFVVTWEGDTAGLPSFNSLQSQRFNRTGRIGAEIVGATLNVRDDHNVAIAPSGDFVVAYRWSSVWAQFYSAAGAPLGTPVSVGPRTNAQQAAVAVDPGGDFITTWQESGSSARGILTRRYVIPPAATLAPADPSVAPSQLRLRFSEPLSPAPTAAAVRVQNLTTGRVLDPSEYTWTFDPTTQVATFNLLGLGTTAADGNYRLTLPAAAVTDTAGNAMTTDVTADFFSLAGDATRDRTVNFDDLLALAKNYNKTGATYTQGDVTGDGVVNFDDLLVLAKNYNKTLPATGPAPTAAAPIEAAPVAAAMGVAAPTTTTPPKPPAPAKKPPLITKPAPRPTAPAKPAPPAAKSVRRDDDKAKPVFSTTPVYRPTPAPAKPKAVAKSR